MKIMSFNLLYGGHENEPTALENRKPRILETIRTEAPDLIGCQEAIGSTRRWLEKALFPDYGLVGCGRSEGCHGEGVPVLYRKDRFILLSLETFWLSETPDVIGSRLTDSDQSPCPRLAHLLRLCYQKTGKTVRFVNTHLDCGGERSRAWELEFLRKRIGTVSDEELCVITGDFNLRPQEDAIRDFLSKTRQMGIRDATETLSGTFHGFGQCDPPVKIDYIFTNGNVLSAKTVSDPHPSGVWYSDHYAVCAELSDQVGV